MDIKDAQKDMRLSYLGGSGGALFSGIVWLVSGILALYFSQLTSIGIFFIGGMFIHPMGMIISKIFKRTGQHKKGNPLAILAMESTLMLFVGLFIAYLVFQIKSEWFFSIMLMIIGGRYVLFQSIYGMKSYWLLGFILIIAAVICLVSNQTFPIAAIIGGIIELIFGGIIMNLSNKEKTH